VAKKKLGSGGGFRSRKHLDINRTLPYNMLMRKVFGSLFLAELDQPFVEKLQNKPGKGKIKKFNRFQANLCLDKTNCHPGKNVKHK
jgi:hypothetical protein